MNPSQKKEIYMEEAKGFIKIGNENFVCQLRKSVFDILQLLMCCRYIDGKLKISFKF